MGDRRWKPRPPPINQKREAKKWAIGSENPAHRPEIQKEKRKSGRQEAKTPAIAQKIGENKKGKRQNGRQEAKTPAIVQKISENKKLKLPTWIFLRPSLLPGCRKIHVGSFYKKDKHI